jgi:hypothetical protein
VNIEEQKLIWVSPTTLRAGGATKVDVASLSAQDAAEDLQKTTDMRHVFTLIELPSMYG